MIYFKPNFADGSIGDAQAEPTNMMFVSAAGCVEEAAPVEPGVLSVEFATPLELTPTIEETFPIYQSDFTPEELHVAKNIDLTITNAPGVFPSVTITPTENMYVTNVDDTIYSSAPGEPITVAAESLSAGMEISFNAVDAMAQEDRTIELHFSILIAE